jgi:hypothetical protein
MELGSSAEIQDNTFEVLTSDAFGGGITDCNPVQCIYNVLTNTTQGLGSGKTPFPISAIDNGANGTWGGAASTPGSRSTASTAWNWFASQSFFISPVMDNQDSASSAIGKWLEAGMCSAFMSEGLLKLVPYGDTSAAGNGCTWIAPQSFTVALDDTCFVSKDGDDPIKIERSAWQDASNKVQVQFKNRQNQYADEIVQESDQAAINRYGLRLEDPQDWDFITTLTSATFAANMRLKRAVNTRNTYTFTLPYSYSYLEPMDIVTISTSSGWAANSNNLNLDIVNMAVRVTKIVDDPKNGIEVTAEDYVWGVHQPVLYNKGISAGDVVVNAYAQPDASEVVMFEAPSRLTGYAGNQIWIGADGISSNWGSCNVWVSQDQTKYVQVGSITSSSRLGVLASALPSGSDPDTVNSMVVTMVDNSAPLEAGTTTDADSNNTMCYVGGEIISYSACALTGANQYTMNGYLQRGQLGSTVSAHAAGSLFMRLDSTIMKYTYDPTWYGKTIYFKFQSVNNFGNCPQDLATLTAVPFTVPGLNPGTVSASTGLVSQGAILGNGTSTLLNQQGSIIPAQSITYTSAGLITNSSVGLSWTSQSVLRPDGSTLPLQAGSVSYTGLASSTTYYLYSYINATTGVMGFTNGNPPPTAVNAVMAIQAAGDGRYYFGSSIALTTLAATNYGTGGSGGGGGCPEVAELVDIQGKGLIPAGQVIAGDYIKGWSFQSNSTVYRVVEQSSLSPCCAWRMIDGHRNSPCESVYSDGQWVPAYRVPGATLDTMVGTKALISVKADEYGEHNYYIGDLLIHNTQMISSS